MPAFPHEVAIDRFIEENRQNIVDDIARLVAVPSVQGPPAPGAPYGAEVRRALDEALDIARQMGLGTDDGDGHVGWAALDGTEEGYIATITHLDVVPPGEGWDADPYRLVQRDGWLVGRGVADDKAPSVLCLYAAKCIQQLGVPLRYGLRVLLGCNEEAGMDDVAYYLAHNPQPLFAFSPDADFPLCNGEKGGFEASFVFEGIGDDIVEFCSGLAPNVIPAKAECVVRTGEATLPAAEGIALRQEGPGLVRISAAGIGGHAAKPEGTRNAIGMLARYLLDGGFGGEGGQRCLALLCQLHEDPYGGGLGIACQDDNFGPLTINGGVVCLCQGRLSQSIDIRYPTAITAETLEATLAQKASAAGGSLCDVHSKKPFYISPENPAIAALLGCYAHVTGREAIPFTMGGGTYARHFKNAVSFGPSEQDQQMPAFAGSEHGPNEGGNLDDFLTALKIYVLSILQLQELNL